MTMKSMEPKIPDGVIPVFDFENETEETITLALECSPQEYELEPGDKVQIYIVNEDGNFPLNISLSKGCLQVYPNTSWGNWYVYKNGKDISSDYRGEPSA